MGIDFGPGAFENPDDPTDDDDVDTSIVVDAGSGHVEAVRAAVARCCGRWWGIDGDEADYPPADELPSGGWPRTPTWRSLGYHRVFRLAA